MNIQVNGPLLGQSSLCEPVLRSVPQWFGLEASNLQYLRDIEVMPTFIAFVETDVIGFLTLKQHNEFAAEILVMAVRPDMHRKGVGRALLSEAEAYLKRQGVEYLQVKTLSSRHPDLNYAKTRAFYLASGFKPLEEFSHLWDEQSPALLMVKKLC
jgi:ribosomal protein S18 acetylase RimI-like enzyme